MSQIPPLPSLIKTIAVALTLILVLLAAAGCGRKGVLYIPQENTGQQSYLISYTRYGLLMLKVVFG